MQLHRNDKLGLRGRRELVRAIERGTSMKGAAAAFSVSPATAHRCGTPGKPPTQESATRLSVRSLVPPKGVSTHVPAS
jgi:hypothetical protein